MFIRQEENQVETKSTTNNILLYYKSTANQRMKPIKFNYVPLVFEKDLHGIFRSYINQNGHTINRSFTRRFLKDFPLAKIEKIKNQYWVILDDKCFLAYQFKQYQETGEGVETLGINVKDILHHDSLIKFQSMQKLFAAYEKIQDWPKLTILKSIKIPSKFVFSETESVDLNLSVLEYAIQVNAAKIIDHLHRTKKIYRLKKKKNTDELEVNFILPAHYSNFVAIHSYSSLDVLMMNEGVFPSWNITTLNYSPLDVAIKLKKTHFVGFLLNKIQCDANYKKNVPDNCKLILNEVINWLIMHLNSMAQILKDDLLIKRKSEVDGLLISLENDKNTNGLMPMIFKFYVMLAQYWYEKYSRANVEIPVENILAALSNAREIHETIKLDELKMLNPLDIQVMGTLKSQLYTGSAKAQNLFDREANEKMLTCQINSNIKALAINPHDSALISLTEKYTTEYFALDNTQNQNNHQINFFHYRSIQLKKFLEEISQLNKSALAEKINPYLSRHFYQDTVFNVADDHYLRTIHHWMAWSNQLDYYDILPFCSENFIYDRDGYTPMGLFLNEYGIDETIKLLKKKNSKPVETDLILNKTGNHLLHEVCNIDKYQGDETNERIAYILKLFEISQVNINSLNELQETSFDILISFFMSHFSDFSVKTLDKISDLIKIFLDMDASLSIGMQQSLSTDLDLLNKSILANWFDLVEYLVKNKLLININKSSFLNLLENKKYSLIIDMLENLSAQKPGVASNLTQLQLDCDIVATLLNQAYFTQRHGAVGHLIAYFEVSLGKFLNKYDAIQCLLTFYRQLDSEELKNHFMNSLVQESLRKALHKEKNNMYSNMDLELTWLSKVIDEEPDNLFFDESDNDLNDGLSPAALVSLPMNVNVDENLNNIDERENLKRKFGESEQSTYNNQALKPLLLFHSPETTLSHSPTRTNKKLFNF